MVYDAFHSDLMAPAAALHDFGRNGPSVTAASRLTPSKFVYFGWGDARFYEGEGFGMARAVDLVRAALPLHNASTVHVQRSLDLSRPPEGWRAIRLRLSREDFTALISQMDKAFVLRDGRPVAAMAAREEVFYEGRKPASLFNECNQWLGGLVGAAGASHNAVLDTVSWGLVLDLMLRAHARSTTWPGSR